MNELIEFGRQVLLQEAAGVHALAPLLDDNFAMAVQTIQDCSGHVVVSGVGKPWLIGQKISATLASTGTPSFALHPAEAMHGDLGRLREQDVFVALSNSGASEEIVRLLPMVQRLGCTVIALTSAMTSPLAKAADIVLNMGKADEACPIGMAPSVSTTVMLALGDALSLTVMLARDFGPEEYARFHPGGALGRSLMGVNEIMTPLDSTARVDINATVADALNAITEHRAGAAFVVDEGLLAGVFTDGDLRRHIRDENLLSQPVREVMTAGGHSVPETARASAAVRLIEDNRIGELPVINSAGELCGHVALKDLLSMHFI